MQDDGREVTARYLREAAAIEHAALPDSADLARIIARSTLRYAVSQRLGQCSTCASMSCDVDSATLLTLSDGGLVLLCAACGPAGRASSIVAEWIWGAELSDDETARAERLLAR